MAVTGTGWTWEVIITLQGGQAHVEWALADLQSKYGSVLEVVAAPHPVGEEFEWQAQCRLQGPAPGPSSEELAIWQGLVNLDGTNPEEVNGTH